MKRIILIFISIFLLNYTYANINIYFFHGEGCPYCTVQKGYFEELKQSYNFNIKEYEIYYNKDNLVLMKRFSDAYKGNFNGVPITIIGTDYFLGANKDKTENLLKKYILNTNYPDPYDIVLNYENKDNEDTINTQNKINENNEEFLLPTTENKKEEPEQIKISKNCISPRGEVIQHGKSILAYKSEIGFVDQLCLDQNRKCNDGELSGMYSYKSCEQKELTKQEYENTKNHENNNLEKDSEKEENKDLFLQDKQEKNIEESSNKVLFIIIGFIILIISIYLILLQIKKQ